jgi:hypothetical protein
MSTEEKTPQEIIDPDQLNIIIRTSIPGYQQIEYKPSMTIKDSDEKGVRFYPLIKLNQTIIDKIPQEYRIKQFFNKGLFESLITYNGGTPAKNLLQATRKGYVDNNINVTLNTIFPVGSVIYIGKKPYAISDHQWTNGDWNIEVKQKKQEIDPNKIKDPILYTQLVRDEILSGEEQLNRIPESIVVGSNYSGPPILLKKKTDTAAGPIAVISPQPVSPPKSQTSSTTVTTTTTGQQINPQAIMPQQNIPPKSSSPTPSLSTSIQPQTLTNLPSANTSSEKTLPFVKEPEEAELLSPEEEGLFDTFKQDLQFSIRSSNFFKNYFKSQTYKIIARSIFDKLPSNTKKEINVFYSYVTNSEPRVKKDGLSNELYEKLCDQVSIIKSPQDGDCFFKAVADGINIYNYENQDSKIYRGNYGKTQLYTINVLRELVARYIEDLGDDIIDNMLLIAEEQLDVLNTKFSQAIEGLKTELNVPEVKSEQYLSELNNIYHSNSNFLIYNPGRIPINIGDYLKPFRVLEKKEISNYIRSKNYWANDVAIEAICSKLNICIIPIEKYSYERTSGKVRIKTSIAERLKSLLLNNSLTKEACSNKIMFLFHENNHYELIRFNYIIKHKIKIFGEGIRQQTEYEKKWFTIFKTNGLVPPFHILILIFGTIYSTLNELSREEFSIYKNIMKTIESSVFKISSTINWQLFKNQFDDMFPNKKSIDKRIAQKENNKQEGDKQETASLSKYSNLNEIDGGGYRSNYRQPYNYSTSNYITKKPDHQGISKIAYTIKIDMELYPGTTLTPEQLSKSKCNSRYNAVKKAFAEFTGKPYAIPPVYSESKNTTKKNLTPTKGGGRKTRKNL